MFEFIIDYCKCTNYCKKAQDFVVFNCIFMCVCFKNYTGMLFIKTF